MEHKVKIYIDKGANINPLKSLWHICDFIRFPVDTKDETAPWRKLGAPTDICLEDANWTYDEDDNALEDYVSSEHLGNIYKIIHRKRSQKSKRGLHLDSAYKSGT